MPPSRGFRKKSEFTFLEVGIFRLPMKTHLEILRNVLEEGSWRGEKEHFCWEEMWASRAGRMAGAPQMGSVCTQWQMKLAENSMCIQWGIWIWHSSPLKGSMISLNQDGLGNHPGPVWVLFLMSQVSHVPQNVSSLCIPFLLCCPYSWDWEFLLWKLLTEQPPITLSLLFILWQVLLPWTMLCEVCCGLL